MYRTCIFCHRDLGSNEAVETFQVGRALAFDAAKGRLWVVCPHCRRWNLSPLEQRWEAIEECERQFRDTARAYSTENVGLAELQEGLKLIRIGRPTRREFAAWRYSRQFWRRRVQKIVKTTASAGTAALSLIASIVAGANLFLPIYQFLTTKRTTLRVRDPEGRRLYFMEAGPASTRLVRDDAEPGWFLQVSYYPEERRRFFLHRVTGEVQRTEYYGEDAVYVAGRLLPAINAFGGTDSQVRDAVSLIEETGGAERLFRTAAEPAGRYRPDAWTLSDPSRNRIANMDAQVRLALEMTAHEDTERRALEGQLALLERAWREAEEIAAIADRLLIPRRVEERFRELKSQASASSSSSNFPRS